MIKPVPGLWSRLLQPFLITNASVEAVAWGASMGILTALLPLFGVQMYVAVGLWMLVRWVLGRTFSLSVCFATSWVMNPLTVVPIYYAYYLTGDALWDWLTVPTPDWTFKEFEDLFLTAVAPSSGQWWERFLGGAVVLFEFFGWPIVLGSVLWAVPLTVATHLTTRWGVTRYRERRAASSTEDGTPRNTTPESA